MTVKEYSGGRFAKMRKQNHWAEGSQALRVSWAHPFIEGERIRY